MEKISVAVRFRPPTPSSDLTPASTAAADWHWRIDDTRISLHRTLGTPVSGASFAFDHVFDNTVTNAEVYDVLIRSVIRAAIDGFNGTAFAYGQTSSGKTFTMNGSGTDPGIIPLAIKDVFDCAHKAMDREFLIRVSYMEIYNEEINDLLMLRSEKLPIHESLERGVYVAGLREEIVNTAEQVVELLKLGEENRHFGQTNMNARSSRSHTIFRMVIESSAKEQMNSGDAIRVSVLNLVDLAGSERIAKTGAGGVRLKEGKHINKSLMILGNVINKLSENGKQRGHIPYRDSKLTRILQPALGGNAKTSIICTAAPEEIHIEETRGTLQFASRAKRVTNCAQVNEVLTDAALLKRQNMEIEELRKKLQGSHSEVLEQVILKQRNDMHKSELECERLAMELEEERELRATLEQRLLEQQKKIEDLSNSTISADKSTSSQLDAFQTPDSKQTSDGFVVKRSNYSKDADFSPMPENLGSIADEDLWMRLNKGCITNLDMLEMTPNLKCASSLPEYITSAASLETGDVRCQRLEKDCSFDRQELDDLKERCAALEKERNLLREENSCLHKNVFMSKQEVEFLSAERKELLRELDVEKLKMQELKEEIGLFSQAFSQHQGQLTSLYASFKGYSKKVQRLR